MILLQEQRAPGSRVLSSFCSRPLDARRTVLLVVIISNNSSQQQQLIFIAVILEGTVIL